jgi:spermidine synthase
MYYLEENTHSGYLIDEIQTLNDTLFIYENSEYRWLTFSDKIIQGVMYLPRTELVVSPISQALMLFLLTEQTRYDVLNLGLGTAAIERGLQFLHDKHKIILHNCVSVELSHMVSLCAKKHFKFNTNNLHTGSAQHYINTTLSQFNVIVLDIVHTHYESDFLQQTLTWEKISQILMPNGQILFNFNPYTEEGLIMLLKVIRHHFTTIDLIEFNNYKNIVICAHKTPTRNLCKHDINQSQIFTKIAPFFLQNVKNIFKVKSTHISPPKAF